MPKRKPDSAPDLFDAPSRDDVARLLAAGWTQLQWEGRPRWKSPKGKLFTQWDALAKLDEAKE